MTPPFIPGPGTFLRSTNEKCLNNALTLFFNDCANPDEIVARPDTQFTLKAVIGPTSHFPGMTWQLIEKPPGAPDLSPGGENLFQTVSNAQGTLRGGLYRYRLQGTAIEAQVWLPLAGPDISEYWQSEITYFRTIWGPAYRTKLDRKTAFMLASPRYSAYKQAVAMKDMLQLGKTLDWTGSPRIQDMPMGSYGPCGGPEGGNPYRLTICGVVLDHWKRNNMMYALIGREMTIIETTLSYAGDSKYDPLATGNPDTPRTKEAYRAGYDLSDGRTLEAVMRKRGRLMQEPNGFAYKEWPSWEKATTGLHRVESSLLQELIQ